MDKLTEIANRILERGRAGKEVRLKADTALFVGIHLKTAAEKPTCDDIARMFCAASCENLCYMCRGKANIICARYGCGLD